MSSSEIPNSSTTEGGNAPGQSGVSKKIKGRRQVEKNLEKMRKADAEGKL